MTPFERVIARRPESDDTRDQRCDLDRALDVTWAAHVAGNDDDGHITVGAELTRDDDRIRYLGIASFMYTGAFGIVLDIRRGPAQETDDGMCDLGPIIHGSWSEHLEWYEYGADLIALRDAGVRLSWEAAQWLHVVGATELDELHTAGLSVGPHPRRFRLRLCHTPFSKSRKNPGRLLNSGPPDGSKEQPAAFAFVGARPGANSLVQDLARLAGVIAGLTRHVDPEIDRLASDPDPAAEHVLRDLLLQRGQPIDPVLRDLVHVRGLPEAPLVDNDSIDDELGAMWKTAIDIDPMLAVEGRVTARGRPVR